MEQKVLNSETEHDDEIREKELEIKRLNQRLNHYTGMVRELQDKALSQ